MRKGKEKIRRRERAREGESQKEPGETNIGTNGTRRKTGRTRKHEKEIKDKKRK